MTECERCASLQQQVTDRDRFIQIDRSIITQRDASVERLRAALMAIRSITIAADHASQRVDDPVAAWRPAIRNIREAAEEALDARRPVESQP